LVGSAGQYHSLVPQQWPGTGADVYHLIWGQFEK